MGLNPWDISGSDDGSDDSESPPSDQSITLELNVYNGRDYAYGIGYGPYDAYIDAIFGAQPDNSIASWQADITFAGGLPAASGTPVPGRVAR